MLPALLPFLEGLSTMAPQLAAPTIAGGASSILGGAGKAAAGASLIGGGEGGENPLMQGLMHGLGSGLQSILGRQAPQAPAKSTSGRSFPWENTALYQQSKAIPQTNFMSMLARLLKG